MDNSEIKKSIQAALNRGIMKNEKKHNPKPRSKKREAPEKMLEREVVKWAKSNGFDLTTVDSSGFGTWEQRKTSEIGISDLIGNNGKVSVWIELKAKSRLSTLSYVQYMFLRRKLLAGAFACCIDSVETLSSLWTLYCEGVDPALLIAKLPLTADVRRGIEEDERPLSFD